MNVAKAIENTLEDISSETTFAYTSVPYLDYGGDATSLDVDLQKVGSGSLSVTSLSADDTTGLSYSGPGSDGFGTYSIIIDRGSIPQGEFSNTIYFNLSDNTQVPMKVYYRVGEVRSRANIGKAFVQMRYADDGTLWGQGLFDVDGSLSFTASDVPPGNYYLLTSTELDGDNALCDYGEVCEYYPEISSNVRYFTVEDSDVSGYEIYIKPLIRYGGANAASLSNSEQEEKLNKRDVSNNPRNKIEAIGSNIEGNPKQAVGKNTFNKN